VDRLDAGRPFQATARRIIACSGPSRRCFGPRRAVVWRGQGNRRSSRTSCRIFFAGGAFERHTWDASGPVCPMVVRDCRNKLIDACAGAEKVFSSSTSSPRRCQVRPLLRRLRPARWPPAAVAAERASATCCSRSRSRALDKAPGEVFDDRGAVRVALHRGLESLTAKLREQ